METSPFNNLAAELRNRVWELALHHQNIIAVEVRDYGVQYIGQARVENPKALTTTCKQIREETLKIFYSANRFRLGVQYFDKSAYSKKHGVYGHDHVTKIERWLNNIGREHAIYLRDVELALNEVEIVQGKDKTMEVWKSILAVTRLFDQGKTTLTLRFRISWSKRPGPYGDLHVKMPLPCTMGAIRELRRAMRGEVIERGTQIYPWPGTVTRAQRHECATMVQQLVYCMQETGHLDADVKLFPG